jgi:hypothetical protein
LKGFAVHNTECSSQIFDAAAGNSSLSSYRVACFLFVSRALDRVLCSAVLCCAVLCCAVLCAVRTLELATCECFLFFMKKFCSEKGFGVASFRSAWSYCTVSDFGYSENRLKTVTPFHITETSYSSHNLNRCTKNNTADLFRQCGKQTTDYVISNSFA